jgi:flagellar secretion chaperone FliS
MQQPLDPRSIAQAYRQAAFENAPPIKIVTLLYEGAIRFLDRASVADPAETAGAFKESCSRADAIVNELRASLDHGHGSPVSKDLERLYLFVQQRIARAVLERDREPLAAARRVMATLHEGWAKLDLQSAPARS